MGSGGGPGNTTVTNQVQLPAWAQPYAAQFLGDVGKYVNQGLASGYPFPAQQLYGFTPDQLAGMNLGAQSALAGEQKLLAPSLANVAATQSGAYMRPQSAIHTWGRRSTPRRRRSCSSSATPQSRESRRSLRVRAVSAGRRKTKRRGWRSKTWGIRCRISPPTFTAVTTSRNGRIKSASRDCCPVYWTPASRQPPN
jgi:hypothetical protein